MLHDKDGNPIRSGKIEEEESKKLRGAALKEVRTFLKEGKQEDEDWKDRALKAGAHLEWFIQKWEELAKAHDAMNQPGVWDQSQIAHGMSNGLIMAMAIFLEETGNPPYHRAPSKYVMDKEELFTESAKGFMIDTVTALESILCLNENGKPKGFDEYGDQEAFAVWHQKTIDRLLARQFTVPEIEAALDRIVEHAENINKNGEEDA